MFKSFKKATSNIKRHSGLTIVSIVMMTTTFLAISLFCSAAWVSNVILQNLESKAEVTAFFKTDVKEEDILGIKKALEANGQVLGVSYISKDEALNIYQDQHKTEPELLENITANIFPPSLEVKAKNLDDLPNIYMALKQQPGIDDVVFYQDVVQTFQTWVMTIRIGGVALIGFLVMLSMLVIFLTLGISIHNSASEIEILKLIGASRGFVRKPFIVQGMIYGFVASSLSALILGASVPFLLPKIAPIFEGITFPTISYTTLAGVVGIEIITGTFAGAFGSLIAIRRYLKY
jgi:cell division transport system permease protein